MLTLIVLPAGGVTDSFAAASSLVCPCYRFLFREVATRQNFSLPCSETD